MANVYIIHGYGANAEEHWFPWLDKALAKLGIVCHRLNMPDSQQPNPDKWLKYLEENVVINEQTIVIGHSLGCIAGLNFLAKNYLKPCGAIWVSGFYQPVNDLPELTPFSNYYAILPPCQPFKSYVISATNDAIVPHKYSDALALHLNADYIRLSEGGHFLAREGITEFPLVLSLIKRMLGLLD